MEGERKWKNEVEKIEIVIGVQCCSVFQNLDYCQKIIIFVIDYYLI